MGEPHAIDPAEVVTTPSHLSQAEERSKEPAGPLLTARLSKRFAAPAQEFVLEVDFQAAHGFTILFGPSGAGKTTLLDCVAGLTKPDSGRSTIGNRIWFDGELGVDL